MTADIRAARRARTATAIAFGVHGAAMGTFITRIPWIHEHLGLSSGELGTALVAPAVGSFLAMPLAARIVHRHGGRAALRGLLLLLCLALPLPTAAPNLPALFVALLGLGAASGMAAVVANAQGVEVELRLGRPVMSGLHGMWSLGGLLASGIGVAAAHLEMDARLHSAAVVLALAALALTATRHLLDVRPSPDEGAPPRFALPPRSALLIGAVGLCAAFAEGAAVDWSGVYLRDTTGASAAVAASCYTAFAATMTAARLLGDAAVGRLGAVRTVRAGGAAATVGGLLVVSTDRSYVAIPGFALIGVGIAVVAPLAFAAAGRTEGSPSRAIAGVASVIQTSSLIAPALVGAIAQTSSLRVAFALVTALTAAMVLGAGALRPRPDTGTTPAAATAAPANDSVPAAAS
ncbi:MFS transporter [Kitasatospora sp. NPDC048365]|uniref:MFS transporter n=1 Tax=Kitasatospora sp. NPDC048365 TaxID=3364050 RepID=UPI00371F1181